MTVSTSVGRQFTITRICHLAYQSVGLMNEQQGTSDSTWPKKFLLAKDLLELIIDDLSNYNVIARARTFEEIDITAANVTAEKFKYTLSANTLNVLDPAMYIPAAETDTDRADGETYVRVITQEEWQRLGSKGGSGQPTLLYPNRIGDTIEAWLWQIPNEAGTVRLLVQRKLADVDDGNATLDLAEYWNNYIVTALSAKLARAYNLPLAVQQQLESQSILLGDYAKGQASQKGSRQIRLNHPTRWSGRRLSR